MAFFGTILTFCIFWRNHKKFFKFFPVFWRTIYSYNLTKKVENFFFFDWLITISKKKSKIRGFLNKTQNISININLVMSDQYNILKIFKNTHFRCLLYSKFFSLIRVSSIILLQKDSNQTNFWYDFDIWNQIFTLLQVNLK